MRIQDEKKVKNLKSEISAIVASEISKSAKIKALFELGLEVKEIAELLKIRYNFAYNVISNYVNINDIDVVKNTNKDSKKDAIVELAKAGLTNIEISKQLKTNYNYVYKVIKEQANIAKANAK